MRLTGAHFRDVSPNVRWNRSQVMRERWLRRRSERARNMPSRFRFPGNRVVVQVTLRHATEPGADLSDGHMAAFHQAVSYRPQGRPHAEGDRHAGL